MSDGFSLVELGMRDRRIFSAVPAEDWKAEDFWEQVIDPDLDVEDKSYVGAG